MPSPPIRVLVVDDTVTYRKIVRDVLHAEADIEVVGTAANGRLALDKIEQCRPDLITLDLEMPEMDGLEVLRRLKRDRSTVGAIVLSAITTAGARSTLSALRLGAFDFVTKPSGGSMAENAQRLKMELMSRIRGFTRSRNVRQLLQPMQAPAAPPEATPAAPPPRRQPGLRQPQSPPRRPSGPAPRPSRHTPATRSDTPAAARPAEVAVRNANRKLTKPRVICIGISTGGPQSLARVLPALPGDLATPILIVQHMPPVFTKSLADDLHSKCKLAVREAADGDRIEAGTVLIAPGGKQMGVGANGPSTRIVITDDPPVLSCKPSVDYLFHSVAKHYGPAALGIIMTGMGTDGTDGCREFHRLGATVYAQDETSCVVFGMPRLPIQEELADRVVPLHAMAAEITRAAGRST